MTLAGRLQREWITGGPLASALRPLSALYGLLLRFRSLLYRRQWLKTASLPVPVIVVGNWIVGGAGKTPTTLALLTRFQAMGIRAGVVSRGYGRKGDEVRLVSRASKASDVGDEPFLIHLRSGEPVAVGRDRVAAAQALLAANPDLQLIVSDDGLQHWRLPRALSILVFDERGIGNGRLLPSGPLRQEPSASLHADELVLYNAPRASTSLPGHLAQRRLGGAASLTDWWAGRPADMQTLLALRGKPLTAAAGMAHPQRFFDMLTAQGLDFQPLPLADHHDFATLPWPADTPHVVLTEKDAVKIEPSRCASTHVWVVTLDFQPEQSFKQALAERVSKLL